MGYSVRKGTTLSEKQILSYVLHVEEHKIPLGTRAPAALYEGGPIST